MIAFLLTCLFVASVQGQEGTGGGTGHGHLPGHTKVVDHTPNLNAPLFFVDIHMHALVMKTESGCYVEHVGSSIENIQSSALKHLESQMERSIKTATVFLQVIQTDALSHFNSQIQTACKHSHLYHWQ